MTHRPSTVLIIGATGSIGRLASARRRAARKPGFSVSVV